MDFRQPHSNTSAVGICEGNIYTNWHNVKQIINSRTLVQTKSQKVYPKHTHIDYSHNRPQWMCPGHMLSAKAACVVLGCYGLDCTEGHLETGFGRVLLILFFLSLPYHCNNIWQWRRTTKMFLDVSYIPERWLAHEVKRDALFSGLQYQFASPGRP